MAERIISIDITHVVRAALAPAGGEAEASGPDEPDAAPEGEGRG